MSHTFTDGRPPRVLQVVLQLDPGGTERLVLDLVRRLRHRFSMAVCCLDEHGLWASDLMGEGVEVTALGRRPGFQPSIARQVARVAARFEATVLHCHHYSPFVYGRLARLWRPGLRIVFTEHGRLSDAPPSLKRRIVNRVLVSGVPSLYAVSHDLRRHMIAEGFPEHMGVIWNGIDPGPRPTPERRRHARERIGLSDAVKALGTVARLDPVKDFGTLIDALALLRRQRSCLLVMIGDGPARATLVERAHALDLDQAMLWMGQRSDVRDLLPGLDVYVNSSISEGISLTLLEAMSAELPIVATRVGGTPEVVLDGETGLLCPPRAPHDLSTHIQTILDDETLAARYAVAGRARLCEHFTLDRMVEQYAKIYETGQ